jgi:hypothetical protein
MLGVISIAALEKGERREKWVNFETPLLFAGYLFTVGLVFYCYKKLGDADR